MFRTLGLRHLIVVNKFNQALGIVTRADLVSTHMLQHAQQPLHDKKRSLSNEDIHKDDSVISEK